MIEKTDVIVMYPADFPICGFDAIVFDSKLKDVFASPRFDALLVDELKKRIIGQRSRTNAEIEQYDRIRFFHTQCYADLPETFSMFIGHLISSYLGVKIFIHGMECAEDMLATGGTGGGLTAARGVISGLAQSTLRLEASLPPQQPPSRH